MRKLANRFYISVGACHDCHGRRILGLHFRRWVRGEAGCGKTAADGHAGCAKGCIKRGDKAVLVTPEGKVYTIANQDKVVDHAGEKVTLVAEASGDNLTVSAVK